MDLKKILEKSKENINAFEPEAIDLRLEEALQDKDQGFDVVISYLKDDVNKPMGMGLIINQHRAYERVYKRLKFTKDFVLKSLSIHKI